MRAAYVVLFLGYVVALPVTFVQVLGLLHDDLSYNGHLRLVMLLVAPVPALLAIGLRVAVVRQNRGAGGGAVIPLGLALAGLAAVGIVGLTGDTPSSEPGMDRPTVVNRTTQTIVILSYSEDGMRSWVTLAPGESAHADRPFLSLDGCYPGVGVEAQTLDGRVLGTHFPVCNSMTWQVSEP